MSPTTSSTNNAAAAALELLLRQPCKPERHGAVLVWRADITDELFFSSSSSPADAATATTATTSPLSSPSLALLRRLLDDCFRRRFVAPPHALPEVVAYSYAPGALFENNLALVAGAANVAAAWRFLAAPFARVGVVGPGGRPSRVEVVAWAPMETAAVQATTTAEERVEEQPPAGPFDAMAAPPRPPPAATTARPLAIALIVETEQRWRLARSLVLVRAAFGDDVRVKVASALRLSVSTGRVLSHADRVRGWWCVPGPLRTALGMLAPAVTTVLGWWWGDG